MSDKDVSPLTEAIAEARAQREFRERGPKDRAECPDCGAWVRVSKDTDGYYRLEFEKHRI